MPGVPTGIGILITGWYANLTAVAVAKIALTVGSIVYSARQAKKLKKSLSSLQDQGTTVTFSNPIASRKLVFGELRVGGTTVFAHTAGTKNEHLHIIVALGKGAFEEISEIYFGDESLDMSGDFPDAGSPYYGYARVNRNLVTGTADATLIGFVPTVWTSAHKLTNITYVYVGLTWNQDVYPQGAGFNISALVKGLKCLDTRTSTTAWTQNPATITRFYLKSEMGVADAEIDDGDFEAAADICDEVVVDADGNNVARYTCNMVLDTADAPRDNLSKVARCMAGWVKKIGGKWRCRAGAHQSSAWSITQAMLRGPIQFQTADEIGQSCNGIRAVYISPETNWQPADVPVVIKVVTAPNITAGARVTILSVGSTSFTSIGAASNTVGVTFTASGAGTGSGTVDPYLGEDNGIRRWRDIELYGTTNQPEARRLMRIELEKARHDLTVAVPCMMHAYKVQAGDYVDLTLSAYGWSSKLFEVLTHKRIYDQTEEGLAVGVDLVLREVSSAIYSRTAADETTADPAPNTDNQDPRDVDEPVIVNINSDDDEVDYLNDGTVIPRIRIEWTEDDPYVIEGGSIEIEYRVDGTTDWIAAPPIRGSDTVAWISPVVQGETYNIRIRAVNGFGAHSDWVDAANETVIGKGDPPNPVTSLVATAIAGGYKLDWVEPADTDIDGYRIYENTTNSIPGSASFTVAAPGNTFVRTGLSAGSLRYAWVKALDTSGNLSTAAGPVSATALATQGATYMYRGLFDATKIYYDNDEIKNVVLYSGTYYKVNNTGKNNTNTWGTPGGADWAVFTSIPALAATTLLLAEDIIVLKTITLGDGTSNLGRLVTNGVTAFGTGVGVFLGYDSTTPKLRVGDPAGGKLAWDGSTLTAGGFTIGATELTAGSGSTSVLLSSTAASGLVLGDTAARHAVFGNTTSNSFLQLYNAGNVLVANLNVASAGGSGATLAINNGSGSNGVLLEGASDRITLGADVNLFRDSANVLRTNDSLTVDGTLTAGTFAPASISTGTLALTGAITWNSDTNLYRLSAANLKTDHSLTIVGALTVGGAINGAVGITGALITSTGDLLVSNAGVKFQVEVANGNITSIGTIKVADGGILIGSDCSITRVSANNLATGDSLTIAGGLTVTSGITSTAVVNTSATYQVSGTNVLGARNTGWANQTASASKADLGALPTLGAIASWASAVDAMLKAHGITGT